MGNKNAEHFCNLLYYLFTWALALLSSVEVQHHTTKVHYIIQQSKNREGENNTVTASNAASDRHILFKKKKNHCNMTRSVDGTKAMSKIMIERAT